jgi:hypothetical protein
MLLALALTLVLVVLWSATHVYEGLNGDAELYAVQAMARIHPGLATDIFLRNESQDKYTIFSALYAHCIVWLGLPTAALALSLAFKFWLFAAAWTLVRALSNGRLACLAIALLVIADGTYGGYAVFRYAEDCLTARSLAETLVISALLFHFYNRKTIAFLIAIAAFFVHPIMALPGMLVLVCLGSSLRTNIFAAAFGVLLIFGVSLWALRAPASPGLLTVLDPPWLEVVRERSVFLFPRLWTSDDWECSGRPLLGLTVTATALRDAKIRTLCIAAGLVGATGLAIAFIAGSIGYIAILIQAQAWRWMWITCFASVLLMVPTAAAMCRDRRCGPLTAMLLIAGWLLAPAHGIICMALGLIIWLMREQIGSRTALHLRWVAGAFGLAIVAWVAFKSWNIAFSAQLGARDEVSAIARMRAIFELRIPAFLVTLLVIHCIATTRSAVALTLIVASLGICFAIVMPGALSGLVRDVALTKISAFADWRRAIPPASSVYVAPAHYSAAFAWFTLLRPSYLSVDQSAGVVFSRATAMEVKRRSLVLVPLLDPDWRLRSSGSRRPANGDPIRRGSRPLTKEGLVSVCRDPQLDFVVAAEDLRLGAVQRRSAGDGLNWSLYDCSYMRPSAPST